MSFYNWNFYYWNSKEAWDALVIFAVVGLLWTGAPSSGIRSASDDSVRMQAVRRRNVSAAALEETGQAPDDLLRMTATLDHGLRGLRDRAILLIGFAGGLRRSEITGLDCGPDHTEEGAGWIEFLDQGLLIRVRGKTGSFSGSHQEAVGTKVADRCVMSRWRRPGTLDKPPVRG
jgi:integrase